MGQYNFLKSGEITSLEGEVMGRINNAGDIRLEDETLLANVLQDLRQQVKNDDSISWPENVLEAAKLLTSKQSGTIRLACVSCDTDEADWVDEFPEGWEILMEVRSLEDSLQKVDTEQSSRPIEEQFRHSLLDWYTHLGVCPCCRKDEERGDE